MDSYGLVYSIIKGSFSTNDKPTSHDDKPPVEENDHTYSDMRDRIVNNNLLSYK